ncbi:UvrD-helicase domain-containing protein [Siccirubricoccus deserti]
MLTDRVLRLLLQDGQAANRILCLTFTKAAAAEMATRLARRLGDWAVADDAVLDAQLAALGCEPGEVLRRRARTLFAEVLELPGGMRISTIHSFCQSLLHAFPLEAGLPPQSACWRTWTPPACWPMRGRRCWPARRRRRSLRCSPASSAPMISPGPSPR